MKEKKPLHLLLCAVSAVKWSHVLSICTAKCVPKIHPAEYQLGKAEMSNRMSVMQKGLLCAAQALFLLTGLLAVTVFANDRQNDRQSERQKKSSERSNRPVSVYRLEFTVDEFVEGKRGNPRTFTMLLKEGETSRVRMGTKILISAPGTEAKYLDLGLKFDGRVEEREDLIVLDGRLDLNDPLTPSGLVEESKAAIPTAIRNFQAEVETAIPLDKNTVLGVYDDPVSKRRYELRATVTKVKALLANQ